VSERSPPQRGVSEHGDSAFRRKTRASCGDVITFAVTMQSAAQSFDVSSRSKARDRLFFAFALFFFRHPRLLSNSLPISDAPHSNLALAIPSRSG
jgi:hypothetical protein